MRGLHDSKSNLEIQFIDKNNAYFGSNNTCNGVLNKKKSLGHSNYSKILTFQLKG